MTERRGSRPKPDPDLPFSRPIDVDRLPETGLETEIEATAAECVAIAEDSGLPAVGALKAHLRVERRGGKLFEVSGELTGRITQTCVVSLDLFDTDVAQPIDVSFVQVTPPPAERPGRRKSHLREAHLGTSHVGKSHLSEARATPLASPPLSDLDDDPPDPIVDGIIDLGAIAYEFLMLARDLYPRKPGVAFTETIIGEESDLEPSAFAALKHLKDRS